MVSLRKQTSGFVRLATWLLPTIFITTLFRVNPVPAAATTCTGTNSGNYYNSYADDNVTAYGVGANTTVNSWSIYSQSDSHQMYYVQLIFHGSTDHVLAGFGWGSIDSQSISSVSIIFESEQSGTFHLAVVTNHAIPAGDADYSQTWQSSLNSMTMDYTTTAEVHSHSEGTWSTNYNVGTSDVSGEPFLQIETDYWPSTYSNSCNVYSNYTEGFNAVYTTSTTGVSASPPQSVGASWTTACSSSQDTPYVVSEGGTCPGTSTSPWKFSGS
jgi:hypothetical protein